MKKYEDMSENELSRIVNKGGSDLVTLNEQVMDFLYRLDLSERARDAIASTEIRIMAEEFGGLMTADEVEEFVQEYYPEEEEE